MTQVLLTKEFGSLRPASDEAFRVLEKIKSGTTLVVDVKDPTRRSTQQHNYWFTIVTLLYENQETYAVFDDYRADLLIHLGWKRTYPKNDGTVSEHAKSISWAKMTAEEFGRLVDDTLDYAVSMGHDRDALEAETVARTGKAA